MSTTLKTNLYHNLCDTCTTLGIDINRLLRIASLPDDYFFDARSDASADEFSRIWNALETTIARPDFEYWFAATISQSPLKAPLIAFASNENIYLGLQRLARFKPLLAPITLRLDLSETELTVEITSQDVISILPDSHFRFELVCLMHMFRRFTGRNIEPLRVEFAELSGNELYAQQVFQTLPVKGQSYKLTLSRDDGLLPLISHNDEVWNMLEPSLRAELSALGAAKSMTTRVRSAIVDCVAAGPVNADRIGMHLGVSKRTMQRRLRDEGENFQSVLNETRQRLAQHYIQNTELRMFEIAILLGFNDQSSLFRAFKVWTGLTPLEFRSATQEALPNRR